MPVVGVGHQRNQILKGIHRGSRLQIWGPELSYLSITVGAAWRQQRQRCAESKRGKNCKMQEGIFFTYCFPAIWLAKGALTPVSVPVVSDNLVQISTSVECGDWQQLSSYLFLSYLSQIQAWVSVGQESKLKPPLTILCNLRQKLRTAWCKEYTSSHQLVVMRWLLQLFIVEDCFTEKRHGVDSFPPNKVNVWGLCFSRVLSFRQPASVQRLQYVS